MAGLAPLSAARRPFIPGSVVAELEACKFPSTERCRRISVAIRICSTDCLRARSACRRAEAERSRAAADQSDALGFLLDWFAEEAAGEALSSRSGTDRETHDDDDKTTVKKTVPELISQCIGLCASHSLSARHFRGAFRILRDADIPVGARRAVLRALPRRWRHVHRAAAHVVPGLRRQLRAEAVRP